MRFVSSRIFAAGYPIALAAWALPLALGSGSALPDRHWPVYQGDAARIIYGTGSDEVLHLAAGAFAGPGDEIIFVRYGFSVYPIATRRVGATLEVE